MCAYGTCGHMWAQAGTCGHKRVRVGVSVHMRTYMPANMQKQDFPLSSSDTDIKHTLSYCNGGIVAMGIILCRKKDDKSNHDGNCQNIHY